jgi:hypothetical protein
VQQQRGDGGDHLDPGHRPEREGDVLHHLHLGEQRRGLPDPRNESAGLLGEDPIGRGHRDGHTQRWVDGELPGRQPAPESRPVAGQRQCLCRLRRVLRW